MISAFSRKYGGAYPPTVDVLLNERKEREKTKNAPVDWAALTEEGFRKLFDSLTDYLIDLGPGAGRLGGKLVAQGSPADIAACCREDRDTRAIAVTSALAVNGPATCRMSNAERAPYV